MVRLVGRLWHGWRLMNLPCDRISELVSRSLDDRLSIGERLAYRSHLVYCVACRRYRRQVLLIREMMRRAPGPGAGPTMPEELRERITRAMKRR